MTTFFDLSRIGPFLGPSQHLVEVITLDCKSFPLVLVLTLVFVPDGFPISNELLLAFNMVLITKSVFLSETLRSLSGA